VRIEMRSRTLLTLVAMNIGNDCCRASRPLIGRYDVPGGRPWIKNGTRTVYRTVANVANGSCPSLVRYVSFFRHSFRRRSIL